MVKIQRLTTIPTKIILDDQNQQNEARPDIDLTGLSITFYFRKSIFFFILEKKKAP